MRKGWSFYNFLKLLYIENVQGWKVPDRLLSDTLKLRPSCEEDAENDPESVNVVEVCRQRLLELEAAVERRYLKAPLGNSRIASLQSIAALSEKSKLEESLDEKVCTLLFREGGDAIYYTSYLNVFLLNYDWLVH